MGRRASHSLDQVLLVALGTASGELLGEQDPERGSRAGMNSGLGSQGRGRRGVGREKHVHTEGQRHLEFPKKYRLQGRRLKREGHRPSLAQETAQPCCPGRIQEFIHRQQTLSALLSFPLLPPSVPEDTAYLLCKGYSPNPRGQAGNCGNTFPAVGCEMGSCHGSWRD